MQSAQAAANSPETSREQLLAVSEYARRLGGDIPGNGDLADLTLFELRVFSQNGEDGVLAEIVRRTGAPGQFFVEVGAGDGIENNCAALADLAGLGRAVHRGRAMRGSDPLRRKYAPIPRVQTLQAMVTPETVDALLAAQGVPEEPDVFTVDVDGSDYWIWRALERHRPRVVVVEYNASIAPGRRVVQPSRQGLPGTGTDFYGASIDAFVALGAEKGYRLVHCDLTGANAFFVRDDLPGDYPDVTRRSTNMWLAGARHPADPDARAYVDLDA